MRPSWLPSVIAGLGLALVVGIATVTTVMTGVAGLELEASSQAQPPLDEFIPLEEVPPEDQLPAAPLLVTAYGLIWIAVFGYVWSITRRMTTVEQELATLMKRVELEERGQGADDRG